MAPSNDTADAASATGAAEAADRAEAADGASRAEDAGGIPAEAGDRTPFPDIAGLGYEQARDELVSIVTRLEGGQIGLEDSMTLWQRGEALAAHCSTWLDGAEATLSAAPAATGTTERTASAR